MDAIDRIRAFNRAHSRRMGALENSYTGAGVSLPEARILHEIAQTPRITARELSGALALDEGYVSRLVAGLRARDLVRGTPRPGARRARALTLTEAGRVRAACIVGRSRKIVSDWLDRAGPGAAEAVAAHLEAVEARLSGEVPAPEFSDLQPGDAGWLIREHAESYARDEGFDASFEPLVARILADFLDSHDPERERGWIARRGQERLGSIFCMKGPEPKTAKLRLFYLVPEARGLGLGRRMMEAWLAFARGAGYRDATLWTHASHGAACALYEKYGFACIRSVPVRSFGVDLIEQEWRRDL